MHSNGLDGSVIARVYEWTFAPLLGTVRIENVIRTVTCYAFATCSQLALGMSVPYRMKYQAALLPTICASEAHMVLAKDC